MTRTKDGYDFDKDTCNNCGITEEQLKRKYAWEATSPDPIERTKASFRLHPDGTVLCSDYEHEYELAKLFDKMDQREERW